VNRHGPALAFVPKEMRAEVAQLAGIAEG
jgi:hypothetical protein